MSPPHTTDSTTPHASLAPLRRALTEHRRRLWGLCYRMAGSGDDADDWLQDSCERALRNPPADLERDLGPWLTRVTINVCRDRLRRRKQRGYAGPWLPGPLETTTLQTLIEASPSPEARYGQLESVSLSFLQLLEALTENERAVLILRDVMGQTVQEAATALTLSPATIKTTLHRARRKLQSLQHEQRLLPSYAPTQKQRTAQQQALYALLLHLCAGNLAALQEFVSADIVCLNDGAGRYVAARRPIVGLPKVALFNRRIARPLRWIRPCELNGTPALMFELVQGPPRTPKRGVVWIDLNADLQVRKMYALVADEKLRHLTWRPATAGENFQTCMQLIAAALTWNPATTAPAGTPQRRLNQLGNSAVTHLTPFARERLRKLSQSVRRTLQTRIPLPAFFRSKPQTAARPQRRR